MKSITIISAFALIAICSAAQLYNIEVYLASKSFDPVNGTLKLYIGRNGNQRDLYRLNETKLQSGRTYSSAVYLPQYVHEVNNASFYWTLSSPIPAKYLISKPSIYLQGVKVIPSYIQNRQFRISETKQFCPRSQPAKIKHKEELQLIRC